MFGDSWTSTFESRIIRVDSQTIDYWRSDGSKWRFQFLIGFGFNNQDWYQRIYPAYQVGYANLTYYRDTGQYLVDEQGRQVNTLFDNAGYPISITDRNGNAKTLTYDPQRRLTQVTDAASRSITFSYADSLNPNQVTAVQDAVGVVATYTYDNSSRLTSVTYADGSFNRFNYDANSMIVRVTDTDNKVLEAHMYDAYSRGLSSEVADGNQRLTVAYGAGGGAVLTDSAGHVSQYGSTPYNQRNEVTSVSGPGCSTCGGRGNQTFQYNSYGQRTSATDAANTTQFQYDSYGNVTRRTINVNGTDIVWNYTYDAGTDEVLTATDPLGNTTTNTYDTNGNLLTTTAPSLGAHTSPSVMSFTYDARGQVLTVTDPLNHLTTFTYTAAGMLETVTDTQNKVTHFQYDARGNRTATIDALTQQPTTFEYDLRNRLTRVTYPTTPPTSTSFTYDNRGRRASVTDANGRTTAYAYDDADRLITVTDAQTPAGVTHYEYDSEDNLINVTDALNRVTHYDYDEQARVTKTTFPSTTFPSNLIETYIYDTVGNLISKTDRKHQTISYSYDTLGRLTSKHYPDTTQVNYTYDAASRLTQVTDATGTYQFTYDNMGRLTQTSTTYAFVSGQPLTVGYAWDAASNLKTMTDPQGGDTTYTYDTLNRLATLKNPQRNQFTFTYDALGRRTQLARPNSVNTNYQYDSLSRVTSLLHQFTNKQGTTTLDGALYSYDAAGNRLSRTNKLTNIVSNYAYDPLYQLTGVTQGGSTTESYSYDPVGNRSSSLGVASYTYNVSNELTNLPGVSYTYDDNGSLLTKNDGSGYSWDFENRLTRVTLPGGAQVNFKYDPMGRRIQKSSSSGTTNYVYDGANILEEVDANRALLTRYTQSLGVDEPLAILKSGTTSYYEADGLGTVTSLTNTAGVLAKTYSYDSFGKVLGSSGTVSNPYGFTGRESDSETGLMYYRARYYDPQIGRFLSEDPFRANAGKNLYPYVASDPINLIDSTGEQTQVAIGGPVGDNVFGHASLIINGQVFSYGTNYTGGGPGIRDWGGNADVFLGAQNGSRATTLLTLGITQAQENALLQYLKQHNPNAKGSRGYSAFSNNCVSQIEGALVNTGIETILNAQVPGCAGGECVPLTAATTPVGLETNLFLQPGLVSGKTTVGQQSVGYLGSLWGTLSYGLSHSH
jgi:RHS repeat-associated protein